MFRATFSWRAFCLMVPLAALLFPQMGWAVPGEYKVDNLKELTSIIDISRGPTQVIAITNGGGGNSDRSPRETRWHLLGGTLGGTTQEGKGQ